MSTLKRSLTIQTLDENFNDVFRMKRDHYDLLEVMSPVHTLARQSVMHCWDILYDDLSSDAKLPFEDSATASTIMHKLSCARTQLFSIENKIQAYAVKHEPEFNDNRKPNAYEEFLRGFIQKRKEVMGPYYTPTPNQAALIEKDANKSDQPSQTEPIDPLAALRKLKNNTRTLVQFFHTGHAPAENSLHRSWELFWHHLREAPPKNFQELNLVTAYLHKLMCTYSQLVNIEIKTVETILKQNYYKLKRPPAPTPSPECLNDSPIQEPEPCSSPESTAHSSRASHSPPLVSKSLDDIAEPPKADLSPLPSTEAKASDAIHQSSSAVVDDPKILAHTITQTDPSPLLVWREPSSSSDEED